MDIGRLKEMFLSKEEEMSGHFLVFYNQNVQFHIFAWVKQGEIIKNLIFWIFIKGIPL